MNNLIYILLACITSCATAKTVKEPAIAAIPPCLQQKIDSIKAQPQWNPPATVEEYTYHGKRVFLLSAPCCDFFSTVVDEDCNYICAPSGGFTGKGDGKCPNFAAEAEFVKVVWKDER
ncbi:DUF6970 domain-containing protein [Aridibaculum aurantiacum]|uniref:DUF6970 domain-containing protein n=1 Tax=Aridibaculum aurantiacum TaxID=2810307 RepID=UPI001F600315|nr:hypothetical protein [Aridibaculum aurantiacum]